MFSLSSIALLIPSILLSKIRNKKILEENGKTNAKAWQLMENSWVVKSRAPVKSISTVYTKLRSNLAKIN
jgi:hypothetical protein